MNDTPAITGGFHHICMKCHAFDQVVEFYTRTLGLKLHAAWGEADKRAVLLDAGGQCLLEIFAATDPDHKTTGAIDHFALNTDDVDAMIEKVRAAGRPVTIEPKTVNVPSDPPMTFRVAFFQGINGESVELFTVLDN